MPVRKFRSVEEMKSPRWYAPGDEALHRAMAALWDLAQRTRTRRYPRGVHRFESIEAMELAQQRWNRRSPES